MIVNFSSNFDGFYVLLIFFFNRLENKGYNEIIIWKSILIDFFFFHVIRTHCGKIL